MKGIKGNGVDCSKKAGLMRTDEEKSGQMDRSNRNSQACSQWLSLVSPPHKISGQPESGEWPTDKRHCAGLPESLCSELFQQSQTEASSMV